MFISRARRITAIAAGRAHRPVRRAPVLSHCEFEAPRHRKSCNFRNAATQFERAGRFRSVRQHTPGSPIGCSAQTLGSAGSCRMNVLPRRGLHSQFLDKVRAFDPKDDGSRKNAPRQKNRSSTKAVELRSQRGEGHHARPFPVESLLRVS